MGELCVTESYLNNAVIYKKKIGTRDTTEARQASPWAPGACHLLEEMVSPGTNVLCNGPGDYIGEL